MSLPSGPEEERGRRTGLAAGWSRGPFGGVMNLAVGVACIIGGTSGGLQFLGTGAGWPFTAIGAFFAIIGCLRLWRWWARTRAER